MTQTAETTSRDSITTVAARRTQAARRAYFAAVAGGSDFRIRRAEQSLRISEDVLVGLTGSQAAARAAEVAYINSLVEH